MIRGLVLVFGFAAAMGAQQTEVAGGYHVVHPASTTATTDSSAPKADKVAGKKTAAKKKHGIKPIVNGK